MKKFLILCFSEGEWEAWGDDQLFPTREAAVDWADGEDESIIFYITEVTVPPSPQSLVDNWP